MWKATDLNQTLISINTDVCPQQRWHIQEHLQENNIARERQHPWTNPIYPVSQVDYYKYTILRILIEEISLIQGWVEFIGKH